MATEMLARLAQQSQKIDFQAHTMRLRDPNIERITHEFSHLKAWYFGARTETHERMSAEQRELFEETLAADQASLQAQLEALQGQSGAQGPTVAGSEFAGQRAAVVMSLVQSARMHGLDPWTYLNDVLTRLPVQLNSRIDELLPHRWQPVD